MHEKKEATTEQNSLDQKGLHVQIPASPHGARTARTQLLRWASDHRLPSEKSYDMALATYEAVANAAEHAYCGDGGVVALQARHLHDRIEVIVRDYGTWLPHRVSKSSNRRNGLSLMRQLADEMAVHADNFEGTTLTLIWHLPSPMHRTVQMPVGMASPGLSQ